MLTSVMVFAAIILGLTRDENTPVLPRTPWLAMIFFGVFLGLAVLAKGPAAIILSGGAVFFWAIFTKRWRDAFRLLHPVAIASFCATALPWYILCAHRNPDFFRVFIIEHNFKRYLTPEFQHIQPFWYYLPVLLAGLFPWLGLAFAAVVTLSKSLRKRHLPGDCTTLVASWAFFCVLFFSTSQSKLPGYILPALPAIGALLSRSLTLHLDRDRSRYSWTCAVTGLLLVTFGVALRIYGARSTLGQGPFLQLERLSLVAIIATSAALIAAFSRLNKLAFVTSAITICLCVLLSSGALRAIDGSISGRQASKQVLGDDPSAYGSNLGRAVFRLRRDYVYQLSFYTHTELLEWTPRESGPIPLLFTSLVGEKDLRQMEIRCVPYDDKPAVVICPNYRKPRPLEW